MGLKLHGCTSRYYYQKDYKKSIIPAKTPEEIISLITDEIR